MTFSSDHFQGFIEGTCETQRRLFAQYKGGRSDFDLILIGSGMGGGSWLMIWPRGSEGKRGSLCWRRAPISSQLTCTT